MMGEKYLLANKGLWFIAITLCYYLAGGPGFEPGLTGPEPVVLPLDDPPINFLIKNLSDAAFAAIVFAVTPAVA